MWKPLWKPVWKPVSEHTKRDRGMSVPVLEQRSLARGQRGSTVQENQRRRNVDDSWYGVEQGDGEFKAVTSASNAKDARRKASSYGRGARPFYQNKDGNREYLD